MKLQPVDSCDVDVLVDNVMDILSTAPSSVTGHIQNVFKAGQRNSLGNAFAVLIGAFR